MLAARRFAQIDVFAPRPGSGNPLAVVHADPDLDPAAMQAMAAWFNLAETTFLMPPTVAAADYRIRIFSTRQELSFAGHPSIGSAHAALSLGLLSRPSDGILRQECLAGILSLKLGPDDSLSVRVPRSRIVHAGSGANSSQADRNAGFESLLRAALGDRRCGSLAPALVEGGRRWWLAELANEGQVRGMRPDASAILALARASDSLGLCVFARCAGQPHDLAVRAFPLGVGIIEDPASGAANAAIAAFLDEAGALDALGSSFTASQGREIGRDARLHLAVDEQRDIWVGGQCHLVVSGTLHWP